MIPTLFVEKEKQKGYFNLPSNKKPESSLLKKDQKTLSQVITEKIRKTNINNNNDQKK
ncbi:hypothetical protein D3C75_1336840 [compost metagenome]